MGQTRTRKEPTTRSWPRRAASGARFDATGIPMHTNNKTVLGERIFLDKTNRDVLHDAITTIDDA
jgi:hypothetical protein